jgi:uncharacterized protein YegP (UPF0339 family)
MTQLFLQLAQSVTGNVITIIALGLAAAIIGFIVAWYYARSVYIPVIKGLETDKSNLNNKVSKLEGELVNLNEKVNKLSEKIGKLELELEAKDKELKELSSGNVHVGKYAISNTKGGGNHFNLIATNGQVILTSLMFSSLDECRAAIESVRENCTNDNRFDRKTSTNNKHFFNLTAPDGQILGKSELYESLASMEKGIASVKRNGISKTLIEE